MAKKSFLEGIALMALGIGLIYSGLIYGGITAATAAIIILPIVVVMSLMVAIVAYRRHGRLMNI